MSFKVSGTLSQSHRRAIELYNKGCVSVDVDTRIDCFKQAIKLNSEFIEAHYNLGLNYFEQKNDFAIERLETCLILIKRRNYGDSLHEQVAQTYLTACLTISKEPWDTVKLSLLPKRVSNDSRLLGNLLVGLHSSETDLLSDQLAVGLAGNFRFNTVQLVLDIKRVLNRKALEWVRTNFELLEHLFDKYPVSSSRFLRRNLLRLESAELMAKVCARSDPSIYALVEYFHASIDLFPFEKCEEILARLTDRSVKGGFRLSDRSLFTSLSFWYQQQDLDDRRVWDLVRQKNGSIPLAGREAPNSIPANPEIKSIGFMSSDFRRHSVSYFTLELVRWLVANQFKVVLFHGSTESDEVTELFKQAGVVFVDGSDMDGDEAVQEIQQHDLDCIIDLNGWTSGTALHLFRNRLAKIQGTYLGYGVSTGYEGVEFRITDQFSDPGSGPAPFYSEELLRMESCFLNYSPIDLDKAPRSLRKLDKDAVKFCSTNHPRKFNSLILELWGQLLGRIPGATLTLKHNDFKDVHVIKRMKAYLLNGGCSEEQLRFIPRIEGGSHLDFYDEFDFLLDTFPYTGTTTTMEALWSGCPVLTIEGDVHRARVTSSILRELDLGQCIFTSSSFVGGVIDLLNDFDGKIFMDHAELQAAIKASPLGDVEKFGPNFIKVLNEFFIKKVSVD